MRLCFGYLVAQMLGTAQQKRSDMRRCRPTQTRLQLIRQRQDPPQWGAGYVPGQLATRDEAPDYSRVSKIGSHWLHRDVHVMSSPERAAFHLANWLGLFFDLHESRMLPPEPHRGFLDGCPRALNQDYLGEHSGTIYAAERIGLLQYHPIIRVSRSTGKSGGFVAFPMLADQLYFSEDKYGVYAVNWCIKSTPQDFIKPFDAKSPWSSRGKSAEEHQARLAIEAEVMREAGIRTISLSEDDINRELRENLNYLYQFLNRTSALPSTLQEDFIGIICQRILNQVPPIETIWHMQRKSGGAVFDYLIAFNTAVWLRKIPVDLNRPVQVDRPLRPFFGDITEPYHQWVSRGSV